VASKVGDVSKKAWGAIKNIGSAIGNGSVKITAGALGAIKNVSKFVGKGIGKVASGTWNAVKGVGNLLGKGITTVGKGITTANKGIAPVASGGWLKPTTPISTGPKLFTNIKPKTNLTDICTKTNEILTQQLQIQQQMLQALIAANQPGNRPKQPGSTNVMGGSQGNTGPLSPINTRESYQLSNYYA